MKVGENLYIRKAPQGKIYHPLEVTSPLCESLMVWGFDSVVRVWEVTRDSILQCYYLSNWLASLESVHLCLDDPAQERSVGAVHHLHWLARHQEQPDRFTVTSEHRQRLDGVRVGHGALQQIVPHLHHNQAGQGRGIVYSIFQIFTNFLKDTWPLISIQ